MVIKLRGECEKSILQLQQKGHTLFVCFFFSLLTRTRFLARPDSQQLKWVWIKTKRRVGCDCGMDWTAQIEIWKSKWSSIQMEFERFVSRLIWINLSGFYVVSLNLLHCITGQTRRSYVILIQLLNMLTKESTVSSSQIFAKWIFVSQFFSATFSSQFLLAYLMTQNRALCGWNDPAIDAEEKAKLENAFQINGIVIEYRFVTLAASNLNNCWVILLWIFN